MTDINGLLRDAGGARPRDELDGLIERLRSVSCILTPECDEHKTVREAAAAITELRDKNAATQAFADIELQTCKELRARAERAEAEVARLKINVRQLNEMLHQSNVPGTLRFQALYREIREETKNAEARIAALEAEREELLGLLFRASEWLVPDEHSPENMDKLACEINAAIDAARSKP